MRGDDMMAGPVLRRHGRVIVVRDDLLPGGSKRRALMDVLPTIGAKEYVYASPAYGYAQIALAYACRDLGVCATVFVAKRAKMHARTAEALTTGAKIVEVPHGYLSNVTAKARAYARAHGAHLLPFGIDSEPVARSLAAVAALLPIMPHEVWSVAGSGTLTRALQSAWPRAAFFAVRIGSRPNAGKAIIFDAPEKFDGPAAHPPPFPSCAEYDAKAWQFVDRHAKDDALFWNVAA